MTQETDASTLQLSTDDIRAFPQAHTADANQGQRFSRPANNADGGLSEMNSAATLIKPFSFITQLLTGFLLSVILIACYIQLIIPAVSLEAPAHNDVYKYSFMLDETPFGSLYRVPRPIGWAALKLGGALPWAAMMWALSLIGLAAYAAPLIAYSTTTRRSLPLSAWVMFALLIVSYPATSLGLVHDVGSRLALLFATISLSWYVAYFCRGSTFDLSFGFAFACLSCFSKETYAPAMVMSTVVLGGVYRAGIKHTVAAICLTVCAIGLSLLHSRWVGSPFTMGEGSYAVSTNPLAIAQALFGYSRLAVTPSIFALLVIGLVWLAVRREWRWLVVSITTIGLALCTLVPNAMLTRHGGCNYESLLVPLLASLAVVLFDHLGGFTRYRRLLMPLLCLLFVVGVVWGEYSVKTHYWWQMGLTRFNEKALQSLDVLQAPVRSASECMVLGLQQDHVTHPWTPFSEERALKESLGFPTTRFTIVSPDYSKTLGTEQTNRGQRRYIPDLTSARDRRYDLVLVFGLDGSIWRALTDREQIEKLLRAEHIDIRKVYAPNYWISEIDPLLLKSPADTLQVNEKTGP